MGCRVITLVVEDKCRFLPWGGCFFPVGTSVGCVEGEPMPCRQLARILLSLLLLVLLFNPMLCKQLGVLMFSGSFVCKIVLMTSRQN